MRLFDPDPVIEDETLPERRSTSSLEEEIVSKRSDQRVTPPKEIVISKTTEKIFSQSMTNIVTSTPFATTAGNNQPGTSATIYPEEMSYADVQ